MPVDTIRSNSLARRAQTRSRPVGKLVAALAASALTVPAPALAVKVPADQQHQAKACALSPVTWVREDRLKPAVRSTPSYSAPIIGTIAPERLPDEPEETAYRGVDIVTTHVAGGWVRIDAVAGDAQRGIAAAPAGWLNLRDVYFTMQTSKGFARPDARSRVVFATDDWIYRPMINAVLDCQGEWLKLVIQENYDENAEDNLHARFTTGWFRGFCGIEETTCDGAHGD